MKTPDMFDNDQILCADAAGADTYKKRIKVAAQFCAERHKIYIVKETMKSPAPWTDDWILRSSRFCNIYRELDKVTVQIMNGWIKPFVDHKYLGSVAVLGRVINHPPTLEKILDLGFTFDRKPNSDRVFRMFCEIKERGEKLVTGAYIVNTVFPKDFPKLDGSKADYIANLLIPDLWNTREQVAAGLETGSFHSTIEAMKSVHGIGTFLANQAAVDLTYTKRLNKASDINNTWNPGPGTTKGIRWITDNEKLRPGTDAMNEALTNYRNDLNIELSKHKLYSSSPKDVKSKIVEVTGPNASNSLCELSKWTAMALGTRDRLKNRYNGG